MMAIKKLQWQNTYFHKQQKKKRVYYIVAILPIPDYF